MTDLKTGLLVEGRESTMVTLRTKSDGTPSVWCDPEIADLVDALNTETLATVASCSGHGYRPGVIGLAVGLGMTTRDRFALIAALEDYARWLRFDLDNPRPEQVERARAEVIEAMKRQYR